MEATNSLCSVTSEPAAPNTVTSWPAAASSRVKSQTSPSMLPAWSGRTVVESGATWAMRIGSGADRVSHIPDRDAVLDRVHASVDRVPGDQLVMAAALGDLTVSQDQDLVGPSDRREPVGDDNRRAPSHQPAERLEKRTLGL